MEIRFFPTSLWPNAHQASSNLSCWISWDVRIDGLNCSGLQRNLLLLFPLLLFMFLSPALDRSLCFRCILVVAWVTVLSGCMNFLLNWWPLSMKHSISVSAPALNVHPVFSIPVRFAIFLFHFLAILFLGTDADGTDCMWLMALWSSSISFCGWPSC